MKIENLDASNNLIPLELKCNRCLELKKAEAFYKRTSVRYDSTCVTCRRGERKERYKTETDKKKIISVRAKRTIEPNQAKEIKNNSNNKTVLISQKSDFNDLEEYYGKMSHSQRHEAVQRFNELITLLREGYGDIIGSEVYVHKD